MLFGAGLSDMPPALPAACAPATGLTAGGAAGGALHRDDPNDETGAHFNESDQSANHLFFLDISKARTCLFLA